jgi:DNA-binding beta-propeller fold protein YncE
MGVLGHESGFSPDGNTFYVASLYFHTLAAVDLSNPSVPTLLWLSSDYQPHGVSISDDGNRLYMAEAGFNASDYSGLTVLDVSQIQKRVLNPTVTLVSRLTWPTVSTPQNATPFTRGGHKYLMEIDEFGSGAAIGAARILDIQNEKKPFVVSNIRLAVNAAKAQGPDLEADPGNDQAFQGYQGHYCSLPSRVDPNVLACSFILSGLRVFDITKPAAPKEIAYFNKPLLKGSSTNPNKAGSFAMSAPAYDEATHDIWYSDGNTGFYVVRLTKATGIKTFAAKVNLPGN